MNSIEKNNVTITGNQDSKETLVFGHGFGTDQTYWRFVTKSFSEIYKIITFDNVGAGKAAPSAYSNHKYSLLQSYADDIIDLAEELRIKDAVFIGHSVSGITGMLASIKAPELFSKHIFMNASPRYLNDKEYIGGFEQSDLKELYNKMQTNYHAWVSGFAPIFMGNPEKPELAIEFANSLSSLRPDVAYTVCKAIFESDHRKDLLKFSKKSLIIQSIKDIAVPAEVAMYLNKNIKDSVLYMINADGHFPHISAPDEVVKALKTFI
ncbi:alpha/beta fold hydrolase [Sporocytophaga myxococcoides]|uniref:alpha/beta fold hydrolase n=1 Tax=Sporocytophaga myxococcoides TaxID=153721 RepID=UPI0004191A84|nr:alpha/beta hydrolase [Sporocytophaga myxococcoides]